MIQAYVFTGAAHSGRREVMADLAAWGVQEPERTGPVVVLLAAGEPASPADALFDGRAPILRWSATNEGATVPELPEGTQTVFFLLDGSADPIDPIEGLTHWFRKHQEEVQLARIITVLNCKLLSDTPGLKLWFDACVRFSDVVLMNKRAGVPNKWMSDYQTHFSKKECYPCLFGLVKDGHVANPAEILFPEARRMSLAFDNIDEDLVEQVEQKDDDLEYEIVDETGDQEKVIPDEDLENEVEPEPFFERDAAGRRKIRLPDISGYVQG
jgi:hypothetical protein